jgi:hypothetical protein
VASAKTTAKPLNGDQVSFRLANQLENNALFQMPVNMAVEDPWTWVIRRETNGHIIGGIASVNDVSADLIVKVQC